MSQLIHVIEILLERSTSSTNSVSFWAGTPVFFHQWQREVLSKHRRFDFLSVLLHRITTWREKDGLIFFFINKGLLRTSTSCMGSAWQVIKTRQERIFQMCNRWNQGGNEQEQPVHQRSPPTERLCSTSQSHTDSRISGLQQEFCLGLFGIIVVMLFQFF